VGIGYAGHVNDLSTGLSYQQQRYYDPLLGRFITADPVVTDMNSGGNFNRYWYANNSPYRYRDPDGEEPQAAVIRQINRAFEAAQSQSGAGQAAALQGLMSRYVAVTGGDPSSAPNVVRMASAVLHAQLNGGGASTSSAVAPAAAAALGAGMIGGAPAPTNSPNYVVTPGGTAFPVPAGATGPTSVVNPAGNVTGAAFTGGAGGANGKVATMRIMNANSSNPNGYIKYENNAKPTAQGVDPISGNTTSAVKAHIPIDR
jgi:RHS repeat-associated protein